MDTALIIIATLLMLAGFAGCIAPVIPGPPISYVGILLLHFTEDYNMNANNENFLLIYFLVTAAVTILDYVIPIWGTKKFGGSKKGVWGATFGLIIGLFFVPIGLIVGPFLGAYIGEIIANTESKKALRTAFGAFIGFLTGTMMKLAVSGILLYHFATALMRI